MKLIQAKLRGTGPLIESGWFQLSAHLNHFYFSTPQQGTAFLRALQTLQPPFSCKRTDPFAELPHYQKRGLQTRHIQAAKRTITLGVFGATAEMVTELGLLDQNLYETDRIEIGRRLDYSRWLNFVELSSSTRWKEIEDQITTLLLPLQQIDFKQYNEAISFIDSLKKSDRVKNEIADRILFFLQNLKDQQKNRVLFEKTVALIARAAHFQTARKVVFKRLPLLIYFNDHGDIASPVSKEHQSPSREHPELFQFIEQEEVTIPPCNNNAPRHKQTMVEKLRSGIQLTLIVSKQTRRENPIFLFDAPECNVPSDAHEELRQFIQETAKSHQCFYLSRSKDFFQPADTGKHYSQSDLEQKKE